MTTTLLHDDEIRAAAVAPVPVEAQAAACPVCPHAMAEHDAIAQRFCRATQDSALERGCACASA